MKDMENSYTILNAGQGKSSIPQLWMKYKTNPQPFCEWSIPQIKYTSTFNEWKGKSISQFDCKIGLIQYTPTLNEEQDNSSILPLYKNSNIFHYEWRSR